MTPAENQALTPRSGKSFTFRSGGRQFFPGDGTLLRFASKAVDTLTIPNCPQGLLTDGALVSVYYKGTKVFSGSVDSRVVSYGPNNEVLETVTVCGPWAKMERLVYRALTSVYNGDTKTTALSSRLSLYADSQGNHQSINWQLIELLNYAASKCGFTRGSTSVSSVTPPVDNCRDLTIAEALRRVLRFYPKAICAFDYSPILSPALNITKPATGSDASYMATVPKEARTYQYNAHPITGVDIEIESVDENGGRTISHQRAGTAPSSGEGAVDVLYTTMSVAAASASVTVETFTAKSEELPSDWDSDVTWWIDKHPRLKDIPASAVTIVENSAKREHNGETATETDTYCYISGNTVGELDNAGIKCRVDTFSCKVKIETADEVEDEVYLSMQFLMTNAEDEKEYRWTTSSTATAGEIVPSGLAAAILADRSGSLLKETARIRLGDSLPALGDACDGLLLQVFEVDCANLTATLEFGTPEHLSPEDMASLLSGFRNRRPASVSVSRSSGKVADDEDNQLERGGIPPMNATDWQPGKKAKTTFSAATDSSQGAGGASSGASGSSGSGGSSNTPAVVIDASQTSGGKVTIDTSELESDEEIAVHLITYTENNEEKEIKYLGSEDLTIPEGGTIEVDDISVEYSTPSSEGSGTSDEGTSGTSGEGTSQKLEIKGFGAPQASAKTAYQIPCDIPPSGGDALLDSEQSDGLLFLARKGTPTGSNAETESETSLAYVKLSGKAMHEIQAVTGVGLAVSNGKLVMTLTKRRFHVPQIAIPAASEIESEDIDILPVESLEVVTGETYTQSTRSFTNTRKRVTVLGPVTDAAGQTPFTATPISEEV